jgi:hypothetical protein
MPEIRDRASIRSLLRADPNWSVYALGDLAPGYFEDCEWHASNGAGNDPRGGPGSPGISFTAWACIS